MDSLKAILSKVKQLFAINTASSRAAITMHRLRNMQMSRKAVKAYSYDFFTYFVKITIC